MKTPIFSRISNVGILPVVKIREKEDSIPLSKALLSGGIDCIEITFRSEHAKQAIADISSELPSMLVGAGTVLSVAQAEEAIKAGAKFIVTPSLNEKVIKYCQEKEIPVIPGISTTTELEKALELGIDYVKFFPAESNGGVRKIKDFASVYPRVTFMPTGGINNENINDYLSLSCIEACGGSFMLPEATIQKKDWKKISELSKEAMDNILNFQLIHIGINAENQEEAKQMAEKISFLFHFPLYEKPKSYFAGKGFEIMHHSKSDEKGHIGIYTPYPEKALYQLSKKGVGIKEETMTRNKQTGRINFVYLDLEIGGFSIHLINPDVVMK